MSADEPDDAGELLERGRDGDLYPVPVEHACESGWLGEDEQGRPRPCPVCRAHLRRRRGDDVAGAGLTGYLAARDPHRHDRGPGGGP
jgi:hypothetical protein